MPQQKQPWDELPDDPITAGPGAQKPQAAAPNADESDLPDDPITGEGKRPASPHDAPFRSKAQLSPEQKAAMERTNKYIQEHEAPDLWGNVKEFGGTIGGDIAGTAKTLWKLGTEDPNLIPGQLWEMAKGLGQSQLDEFKKAYDAAQKGDWSEAAGYTGAGPTPNQLVLHRRGTPPLHVSYRSPMPRVGQWKDRHVRPQSASALIDGETVALKEKPRLRLAREDGALRSRLSSL